jgi:hypothetical protein
VGDRRQHLIVGLVRLDDRAGDFVVRHQSWRFAIKMLAVEIVLFAGLSIAIVSLITGRAEPGAWWYGPLVALGQVPFFVFVVPVRRGGRLSRLDDSLLGPPRSPRPGDRQVL